MICDKSDLMAGMMVGLVATTVLTSLMMVGPMSLYGDGFWFRAGLGILALTLVFHVVFGSVTGLEFDQLASGERSSRQSDFCQESRGACVC